MQARSLYYTTGVQVHTGDDVTYNGQKGQVAMIAGDRQATAGIDADDWQPIIEGLLLRFESGALLHLDEADDSLLVLIDQRDE